MSAAMAKLIYLDLLLHRLANVCEDTEVYEHGVVLCMLWPVGVLDSDSFPRLRYTPGSLSSCAGR